MSTLLYYLKKLIPGFVLRAILPVYHYLLSLAGAVWYGFPSRKITVIGVTGTKGKSSVVEIVNAIFEAEGKKTALAGTIRFKVGDISRPNLHKMTMPGRFFVQKFLREAVREGCDIAILEMTSQGVLQYRHKWIDLDALIFTNISPEHIESHGSFEKYLEAKLELARLLEKSRKRPRRMIANADDEHGKDFLAVAVEEQIPYSLRDLDLHTLMGDGACIVLEGVTIRTPLIGLFNVYNTLAAIACARAFGISLKTVEKTFSSLPPIRGRVEKFESPKGIGGSAHKRITVVVDYAHTTDSLTQLYQAFSKEKKICILGNTGGGRDTWKRPEMGRIAAEHCDHVILTNEDPYDEDPRAIVNAMAGGIEDKTRLSVILDRREAIREALRRAPDHSVVLICGKGTDPYIMGPRNTKEPWSDAKVVQEEMARLFGTDSLSIDGST